MNTIFIGIAGGTGSGKTTLTEHLAARFGSDISVVHHDNYYKRQDRPFAERCQQNYDHPDAFDTDLMIADLKALKRLARWLVAEAAKAGLGEIGVKVFTDTAPVMEKPLAARAGLGWQGKHTNLVSREFGSWLVLGVVLTEAVKQHLSDEYVETTLKTVPHTRLGHPDDIAAAVAFLASDDGAWVNGQVWHVNGGLIKRD